MPRKYHRKQAGQSLPLLAVMLVVIIALVGLSVDVGNAYGQQRRVQNVSNAGAVAAMNSVLANESNESVCTNVKTTLASNRVEINAAALANNAPQYTYDVHYVMDNGSNQLLCSWNGSTLQYPPTIQKDKLRPSNIVRVQVTVTERIETHFARIAGRPEFIVNGNGNACVGGWGTGVYPIGVPLNLEKVVTLKNGLKQPFHRVIQSNGVELPLTSEKWGQWDKMQGMTIVLPVNTDDAMPGTHVSYLDWDGGSSNADELKAALTYPGNLQNGFKEATPPATSANTLPANELSLGDWIQGKTGVDATTNSYLDELRNPEGLTEPRDLILPMYDIAYGQGSNSGFHIVQMGYFRVVGVDLSQRFGVVPPLPIYYNKYLMLQYMGPATVSPEECSSEPPTLAKKFNVEGVTKVIREYRELVPDGVTYDIVLVMDVSSSMRKDWDDNNSGPSNARLEDAKRALVSFVKGYDLAKDPDARMAFVTFGGTGSGSVKTQVGWTTACLTPMLNCGVDTAKWPTIQLKAAAMTTDFGTPGPMAFERVEDLLRSKRTPPAGKKYGQIVVFATDGIFNVCGSDSGSLKCPYGQFASDPNTVAENQKSGRPIWQAQQVASRIKGSVEPGNSNYLGASVFMVTLVPNECNPDANAACFNTTGLPEMSSGTGYYYSAKDGAGLSTIYTKIKNQIQTVKCKPVEKKVLAEGAKMVLKQPGNSTFSKTFTTLADGKWSFTGLEAGQYVVKVDPFYSATSPEENPPLTRVYSRLRNELDRNEETQASIYINPQYPNGSTVYGEVLLSLAPDADGTPRNACNTP